MHWQPRHELSLENRLRRSYYELLRDEFDQFVVAHSLKDSFAKFQSNNTPYPFVERKELKPRARIPKVEYDFLNSFLIIFVEDTIPPVHKKYIRFFDSNRTTKTNLLRSKTLELGPEFDRSQKFLDSVHFYDFIKDLLPVDYALLIQRDPGSVAKNRYQISHFHVRIDWPITEAAEDLARHLRYISKDIYEKGEKCAEDVQKKFFEYYGLPDMIGGRRTAAAVAAQYLRRLSFISTVYVSSSESRSLIRYAEDGVSKTVLTHLSKREITRIAESSNMLMRDFRKNYMLEKHGHGGGVFIFRVTYAHTAQGLVPEDGKLRDIKPELFWLTVSNQQILPLPGVWDAPPLRFNLIYS